MTKSSPQAEVQHTSAERGSSLEPQAQGRGGGTHPETHLLLCVSDTPENARWECTVRTLTSLGVTADLRSIPLWIIDNGSTCGNSRRFLSVWCGDQRQRGGHVRAFRLPENRYATYAFNRLLAMVPDAAVVVRLEYDMEFITRGWPWILSAFLAESGFGMASALPQDLPTKAAGVASVMLAGRCVRIVDEVPGFCTAFAPALRRRLGAFLSAGRYIEDVITSDRARALGYRMAFLDPSELLCYHVDRVASPAYQAWKQEAVRTEWTALVRLRDDLRSGARNPHVALEVDANDGLLEIQ